MKTNDTKERLKALMSNHAAAQAPLPPKVAAATSSLSVSTPLAQTLVKGTDPANWNRVTIRLPVGELAKINDVVIATQQANRSSKVTTTDVLRAGLRRLRDQEAISTTEIQSLRSAYTKGQTVRPS